PKAEQWRVTRAKWRSRPVERFRFTHARLLAERRKPGAERAISVGSGGSGRSARRRQVVLTPRNRRHRPSAPWWWRGAGIAARGGAARVEPGARTDRGRAWIAARRGR